MSSLKQVRVVDIPPLEIHQQQYLNFMSQFEPFLKAVTGVLSHHLDQNFEGNEEYVPAALIFNPLVADNVFWINGGKEYGKLHTKDAMTSLKRFERWLLKTDFVELPYAKQKKIIEGIPVYAGPLYFFVSEAVRSMETTQLLAATKFLVEHLEQCTEAEAGHRGNYRAFRTAVALRAIFETYSPVIGLCLAFFCSAMKAVDFLLNGIG